MPTKTTNKTSINKKRIPALLKGLLEGDASETVPLLLKLRPPQLIEMLTSNGIPAQRRAEVLRLLIEQDPELATVMTTSILDLAASEVAGKEALEQRMTQLKELIDAMEAGPLRTGRFLGMIGASGPVPRALVTLHDGSCAASPLADPELAKQLERGDGILLDGQGRAVLHRDATLPETGETATLERRINDHQVLVTMNHDERRVLHASAQLTAKLDDGDVEAGASILVNTQQNFAFDALPVDDELSHYRYLDHRPVPDRVDMGCPPGYVDDLVTHAEMAMRRPELLEKWKIPLAQFVLLEGVTGSGKTLSIDLLQHRLAGLVTEVYGLPPQDLPPFVFRVRPSEVLEKWLGSSDRNLARVFREVEQMASQPLETPDGVVVERRPIIGVIEEFEGIARTRGGGSDPIYDRILVTLLQCMDPGRSALAGKLVYWICTTNLLREVDSAAIRRAGGKIERFSHLSRSTFISVLNKHLGGLTFAPTEKTDDPAELQRCVTTKLANWMYSPNGEDPGQVELLYANSEPEKKYRRDFLTGAAVARSVQQATGQSGAAEFAGAEHVGLTADRLMAAFDEQIGAMARQLSPQNVTSMVRIKEGGHVTDVRRIAQPRKLPHHYRRAS